MEIEIAAIKIGKWATSASGDTLEVIERPQGGISVVLVDGQRSGRAAKTISNIVARKAVAMLAEGVRDGAAARAAHDYLFTYRGGRVSATLNILSVDLVTSTLVISRNSHCPVILVRQGRVRTLDEPSAPVGQRRLTRPQITELPLEAGAFVVVYTDGLAHAGARSSAVYDVPGAVQDIIDAAEPTAEELAQDLFDRAMGLEDGRPRDDISVVVLHVSPRDSEDVRHMAIRLPI